LRSLSASLKQSALEGEKHIEEYRYSHCTIVFVTWEGSLSHRGLHSTRSILEILSTLLNQSALVGEKHIEALQSDGMAATV
jgi:hypothetical protein